MSELSILEIEAKYKKREMNKKIFLIGIYAIVTAWAIFSLVPLYWMFNLSFTFITSDGTISPAWFVKNPIVDNFIRLFTEYKTARWLFNSILVASVVTVSNVIFASLAGYSFAKLKFPGKDKIFYVLLTSLMIPFQISIIPLYILFVRTLGLGDTYAALIIPPLCTINNVFLMRQYMSSLPSSLIAAGRIDALSEFGIFRKIILPLAKPGIAVLAIFTFVAMWNDFFWSFLVTSSTEMRTIQVGLSMFSTSLDTDMGAVMAGSAVAAVPMFILFFALQKYFLKGITVGAVKG